MKLTVKNYECYARPQNDMVGHIRDTCYEFNYTFNTGIYFLTGEIDVGAWSFAYSLLDDARDACVSHYESMTLNGNPVTLSELRKMSFHVGQYKMYGKKSFEDVLKKTLKKSNINCSYEDMVNRFPFENMVAEASRWRMHFVNQKIWYISSLIGLALNKKIFVFPWLSKKEYLSGLFQIAYNLLVNEDVIVLVPCSEKIRFPEGENYNVVRMASLFNIFAKDGFDIETDHR